MTKPVIVTRIGKGNELTFSEGDANFTNLRDATISVSGDSGTTQNIDLNGSISVAGGTGLSTVASTDTLTVNLDNTTVTAGAYTNADITVDAQGRVTAAANGSPGYDDADARGAISVTDAGGEGSLAYESSTGVITYTGPSFTGLEVTSAKNQVNGYAGLDSNGKVAAAQLPSYVDDVVEVANFVALPAEGETGKIYVAIDNGKIYRWSGSAYVEISASPGSTDAVTEGTINLYFTTQRARDAFSASTGITITNGAVATTITQYTDSLARSAVSVTDAGGDGSLSYNNSTGVITYTGPSASEVRAHISAGTGISITDGVITNTQSAGIADVVADTTPQLGGSLDVNGQSIVSVSNGNIAITPNGTGSIVLDGLNWPQTDGTANQVLQTNGSGQLSFATASAGGSSGVIVLNSVNYYIAFPNTANGDQTNNWTLHNNGGISGVSVSTTTFTLPAGTYTIPWPFSRSSSSSFSSGVILRNTTDGTNVFTMNSIGIPHPSTTFPTYYGQFTFTIAGTKTFTFRTGGAAGSTWFLTNGQSGTASLFSLQIIKSS